MKIKVSITLDVDPVAWVAERGENKAGVRESVRWWARATLLNGSAAVNAAAITETGHRPGRVMPS